jgi:hypothetical protein
VYHAVPAENFLQRGIVRINAVVAPLHVKEMGREQGTSSRSADPPTIA